MTKANSLPSQEQAQAILARTQRALAQRAVEYRKEQVAARTALESQEKLKQSLRADLGPAVDLLLEALGPLDGLATRQGKISFQHEIFDLGQDIDRGWYAIIRVRIVPLVGANYKVTLAEIYVTAAEHVGLYYGVNSKQLRLEEACEYVLAEVVPQIVFD